MICSPPGSPSHPTAPPFLLAPLSFQSNSIFSTSLQHWLNLPQLVLTPCQAIFVCHLCFANTVHTYPREILETDDKGYLSISSSETHVYTCRYKCMQTCRVLIHSSQHLSMHTHQHTSKQPRTGTHSTHFAVHEPLSYKSLHTPLWKDLL